MGRLAAPAAGLALLVLSGLDPGLQTLRAAEPDGPFPYRGYYFILSRNPGYGLEDCRSIVDRMAADRANLLILWIGGGFPSKRYPETWDYQKDHRNIRENFAGAVIDHAHSRGIKVLLGLTPFAYDGVNRYGVAHPELGATDAAGKPAVTGGIHSLGRGLCPSKPAAREFMLGYCRELWEDFYPSADGLFLEHSDYGTCQCGECAGGNGLRREWELVEALASRAWGRRADALMLVYPQYASLGVEYDPRYVVFLAPHNMKGAERVKNPKVISIGYWDCGAFFGDLCRRAAREGYAGVVPSMENFTYENPHAFDARWGPPGSAGWDDLLVRVTRLSFREYAARPGLDDAGFRDALRAELFDPDSPAAVLDDLLTLHRLLNRWDGWTWRGGILKVPAAPVDPKALGPNAREALERDVIPALRDLRAIRERALASAGQDPASRGRKTLAQMAAIAGWVLDRWKGIVL
jgi:hypothetical protein